MYFLNVWNAFNIQNLGQYVDLYLKLDVLLLADVFEKFRKTSLERYKLDPAHYLTSSHMSFDALFLLNSTLSQVSFDLKQILRAGKTADKIIKSYSKIKEQVLEIYNMNLDDPF